MFKIYCAAVFTLIAVSVAGLSKTEGCDGDGYGVCRYPIVYASKKFVRNAVEEDTAKRASKAFVDMTAPPVKFQDRLANR